MDDKSYKIPPRIHFIWAGGKRPMDPQGVELVSCWIKANRETPHFVANLWIDKLTAERTVVEDYQALFKEFDIPVIDRAKFEAIQLKGASFYGLVIRDIGVHSLRGEHVAYEIDKLRPNYGSSSDLLRYNILLKEPGFYCDCSDVGVGETGLNILFSQRFDRHVVFLEHRPQQPLLEKEALAKFEVRQLGNDTFAVTEGPKLNPALMEIIKTARENYDIVDPQLTSRHIITAHSGNNIKDVTIFRTGPGLIRRVLLEKMECRENGDVLVDRSQQVEIRRVRDGQVSFVLPKSNTGNWLNLRVTEYDEKEKAFQAVINTIKFEAKHFKILRLDDHIHDVFLSTRGKVGVNEALASIRDIIREHAQEIRYVQLTGRFKETMTFARENNFKTIFDMPANICILAIQQQAYLNDFNNLERYAQQVQEDLKERVLREGMSAEGCLLKDQRPDVKIQLAKQIQLGLEFFEHLSSVLDMFGAEKGQTIRDFLVQRLIKYQEYAKILNNDVSLEYNIDIERTDRLLLILQPKELEHQARELGRK